jgi:thiosulfate dehydrogenase
MGRFVLGLVIGLCIIPAAVWIYLYFGFAPVATSAGAMPFERSMASMALHARIDKEAPKQVPIPASEANLVSGAKIYHDYCIICHAAASGPKTVLERGMFPLPPMLLQGKGVTDDPPGRSYWVVKNGIRTTGMPAFGQSLTDTQLWQVSLMVANAHNLPAGANQYIAQLPPEWK